MSADKVALLGAIAGFTIFLGLPIGRLRRPLPGVEALLSAVAIGILAFLLIDVMGHAWEPVDQALAQHRFGTAVGDGAVLTAGFGLGLIGLVYVDQWIARRAGTRYGRPRREGPGTTTA